MYKTGVKLLIFLAEVININDNIIKGKTWSRGTNSRLRFGVNVNLNLSTVTFNRPRRKKFWPAASKRFRPHATLPSKPFRFPTRPTLLFNKG